ncbi:hypothetical protein SMACR_09800 [Sordaria macrospora]|uniref:WGS project CABT00000000 data, contig 2.204 n=2 Tax=Sordaria macrospora TaxID=5147 RepID=F7WCR2_SORMK|nr:uncharacterized protein SMAC_09800 [Sordaria macrospora k-hell]KAA8633335.1 hypothetical protein SMACR_09800 [Sordaria macrospora]WPJ63727.1 hypothetical protein SMAC4_09800 [Sordaria macrospora]CCC05684.1 unnamed protein product [Sordaria macrospora k-hell]
MPHQLRIEDAGVATDGSTGGGLVTSRHAPGNLVAGTPTTTMTAGGAEPEVPAGPKPPQEDAEKFILEAMNFPGVNSPQDARAAWAERLFEIAKDILRARGWAPQLHTEQLRNDMDELKKMVADIAKKQATPPKTWATVVTGPNARPTGLKRSHLAPMGTQAFVPLRAERCLTVKLNDKPLTAEQERRTASDIVKVINQKFPKADARAVTKLRLSGDYIITFGEEGRKWYAKVAFRTVSVIAHGVPWALIDNLEAEELAKELSAANKITYSPSRRNRYQSTEHQPRASLKPPSRPKRSYSTNSSSRRKPRRRRNLWGTSPLRRRPGPNPHTLTKTAT